LDELQVFLSSLEGLLSVSVHRLSSSQTLAGIFRSQHVYFALLQHVWPRHILESRQNVERALPEEIVGIYFARISLSLPLFVATGAGAFSATLGSEGKIRWTLELSSFDFYQELVLVQRQETVLVRRQERPLLSEQQVYCRNQPYSL
jgi:hypothetical protein